MQSQRRFVGDFGEPRPASHADVAGFPDDDRASVPLRPGRQQAMQRRPPRVARHLMPFDALAARMLPLIVRVEVDAKDVEVVRGAAQLLAGVPYLLDYKPERSLVLVGSVADRRRMGLEARPVLTVSMILRVDLPPAGEAGDLA